MFIDMHCHILPGIDDGADSFDEACELIMQAVSGGTTMMAVTPHFNSSAKYSKKYDKHYIVDAYKQFKLNIESRNIPIKLFLGSETLLTNSTMPYKHDEFITINGSRYILVEFHFDEDIRAVHRFIDEIISYGLVPVIAHPERYEFLHETYDDVLKLINKGCKIQINKDSPFGKYGPSAQAYAQCLIKNDLVHLIASDCHNVNNRNADMRDIYEWLLGKISLEKIVRLMHDNPKRILLDRDI